MGTNVIPALLKRLNYREPVFNLCDYEVSLEAMRALVSLREHAKPALPALTILMDSDDEDLALRAMVATVGTGADAVPCLIKGLTNRFPDVRGQAASYLTGESSAQFGGQRRQAIPFLVKLLSDPEERVRLEAANALKELDPQAAAEAGVR
jgi:HEAT repeat protein